MNSNGRFFLSYFFFSCLNFFWSFDWLYVKSVCTQVRRGWNGFPLVLIKGEGCMCSWWEQQPCLKEHVIVASGVGYGRRPLLIKVEPQPRKLNSLNRGRGGHIANLARWQPGDAFDGFDRSSRRHFIDGGRRYGEPRPRRVGQVALGGVVDTCPH